MPFAHSSDNGPSLPKINLLQPLRWLERGDDPDFLLPDRPPNQQDPPPIGDPQRRPAFLTLDDLELADDGIVRHHLLRLFGCHRMLANVTDVGGIPLENHQTILLHSSQPEGNGLA